MGVLMDGLDRTLLANSWEDVDTESWDVVNRAEREWCGAGQTEPGINDGV